MMRTYERELSAQRMVTPEAAALQFRNLRRPRKRLMNTQYFLHNGDMAEPMDEEQADYGTGDAGACFVGVPSQRDGDIGCPLRAQRPVAGVAGGDHTADLVPDAGNGDRCFDGGDGHASGANGWIDRGFTCFFQ